MSRIVNAYTVSPGNIQPDDVMMYTVKAIVTVGRGGLLKYRLYRCLYDAPLGTDGLPDGDRIGPGEEASIARGLFPSLTKVASPDDW